MIYTVTLNPAIDKQLTIPEIIYDKVLRAVDMQVDIGGKGFNVSRMLHEMDAPSIAIGFVGGKNGEFILNGLSSLGIETELIWVEGETRTNVSIVESSSNHYIKVNEPGPTVTEIDQDKLMDIIRQRAKPKDWWVLSGSVAPGVRTEIYAEIISTVQAAGAKAVLDSSGTAIRKAITTEPYLVKPNTEEASQLTNMAITNFIEAAEAARSIQGLGPKNVAISMGSAGAVLSNGKNWWLGRSPQIEEGNPIGAGDAMVGGLVWSLDRGDSYKKALCWGIACGAATASENGTEVGTRRDVETLAEKIEIEEHSHAIHV